MKRGYIAFQCPFFKRAAYNSAGKKGVKCEVGDILFADLPTADDHIAAFCANEQGWRHCSIAITLQRYYEREDENG